MIIDKVIIERLDLHVDDRGRLAEILRCDDKKYEGFGQVYFTTTLPNVVKGWHFHKKQQDCICCVCGAIKLVVAEVCNHVLMHKEFILSEHNLSRVVVPCGLWHGWRCISEKEAIIINVVDRAYDPKNPDEVKSDPHGKIQGTCFAYDWSTIDR